MIQPTHYLFLGVLLFTIGIVTTVARRHPLIVLLGIELMLQAVNVVLVALTSWFQDWNGEIAVFVVMAIAAVELAVGLGITLAYGQQQNPSWPGSQAK
jgi:NADH-quinone oxidoreductase subunit K